MQFSLFSPDDNHDDLDNGGNDKHYGNEYDDFADGEPFALKAPEKQGNYSLRRPPKLIIPQAVIRH